MKYSSLVGHVIQIYGSFIAAIERPADLLIRQFFYERKYLGAKDRRFIADAYFGTIKNKLRCEHLAMDAFPSDSPVTPLVVAAYLIASVGQAPHAIGASLRELGFEFDDGVFDIMADRTREVRRLSHLPPVERLAIGYSFPPWLVERLSQEYGLEEVEAILDALNDEAHTVLRVNTLLHPTREDLSAELQSEGCATSLSMLAPDALLLPRRANVMGLNSFKRGAFEIQDEASQMVAPFAKLERANPKVLDACAGAGGKTLHLAALLKNRGEIYATDVDKYKLEELKRRVRRSTAQNVRIVFPEQKSRTLGPQRHGWFDLVLLDVPCSGTGTLRRNPGIKWVITPQMISELIEKQRSILVENLKYLKPEGTLLYATCSILKEEGEDQVAWLLQHHPEFELEEELRTRPDQQGCDGFYAARLKKRPI